ncbi:hypothetical protein LTR93_011350 [Exophiala xenobiotica]|nr:hypothetical protein LTR93_011350 [Exophiala xenobiotica]
MADLNGIVIALTGWGSGIGLATVLVLNERSAIVWIADISENPPTELKLLIELGTVFWRGGIDVSDRNQSDVFLDEVVKSSGRLDGMVNVAGVALSEKGPNNIATDDTFTRMFEVNVRGNWNYGTAAIRIMCKQEPRGKWNSRGSIVNIASGCGLHGVPKMVAYSATKHAVVGLCRSWAQDWTGHGIRVNGIAPGYVQTPALEEYWKEDGGVTSDMAVPPARRYAMPSEIGTAVAFLLSDDASYVSGHILSAVHPGATAGVSGCILVRFARENMEKACLWESPALRLPPPHSFRPNRFLNWVVSEAKMLHPSSRTDLIVSLGTGTIPDADVAQGAQAAKARKAPFRIQDLIWEKSRDKQVRQAFAHHPRYHRLDHEMHRDYALDDVNQRRKLLDRVEGDDSLTDPIDHLAHCAIASLFYFELSVERAQLYVNEQPMSCNWDDGTHRDEDGNFCRRIKYETGDQIRITVCMGCSSPPGAPISGLPSAIVDLASAQGLNACFGTSDHRKRERVPDDDARVAKKKCLMFERDE